MLIKMLLEEAGQYFYCEARKTATHEYEGIVHFLHKVGDGNAFVRGKTHHLKVTFDTRHDALTAAECHGKHIATNLARVPARREPATCLEPSAQHAACNTILSHGKSAC